MPHGKLTVIVDSATGIKDPSKHGRGGSYCTLQCGHQVLSTHVAEGAGSHPTFQTEFKFEIDRSTNDLVISVYSTGSMGGDELVGSTALDFKTVFFHGHVVPLTAYPLSRLSGRAGGHISVSFQFKARPSPYAHNPHGPVRRHSAPLPTHPHHNYETNYEDGCGSSGSSESSRSDSKRSGDLPFRRSQSQPEQHYEDHESPPADAFEYQNYENQARDSSFENYEHQRPSQQPAHQAQPRYHHARPSAHQAMPNVLNVPHRAIPVKRGTPGPQQPVQRVQYQPQQRMQGQPQQGMQYRPPQGMQGQPRQGMQGQPQQRMQGQPRQGMQYRPPQGMQGQTRQGVQYRPSQGMQGQPQQRMQGQTRQGVQCRPPQGMQRQQQPGVMAQVARQSVQAMAGGIGDMLGGGFGDMLGGGVGDMLGGGVGDMLGGGVGDMLGGLFGGQ